MRLTGEVTRLWIHIGEHDRVDGRNLATTLVERAHAAGLSGATVIRGIEGYGVSNHIHTTRVLRLSEDLPVVVVIIDTAERIGGFLPVVEELVTEGLVVTDRVRVVLHRGRDLPDVEQT